MPEFEVREWIAYGLITATLLAAVGGSLIYQRRRRWRKLRMAGDSTAKRRELGNRV